MLAGHGSSVEVEGSEQAGLVVSVLHLPLGSEVHAVLATDGLVPDRGNPGGCHSCGTGKRCPAGRSGMEVGQWRPGRALFQRAAPACAPLCRLAAA
jgi:hypothetical protein